MCNTVLSCLSRYLGRFLFFFFFSSRRRHTRSDRDWSSDVCSSDLEIDAPLDDANIGRFVEMLRSMQTHTQFILITHNRKTMEIADRLYGVTMEEPGVSKLISVHMN